MTDLERIARAIWADRAYRILAEDIAAQREADSAGHLTYDELGEGFQRGLLSEARAAIEIMSCPSDQFCEYFASDFDNDITNGHASQVFNLVNRMMRTILSGENAPKA